MTDASDESDQPVENFAERINRAMRVDQFRLRRAWRNLEQAGRRGKSTERGLAALRQDLEKSVAVREQRAASRPVCHFDFDLPILARREEIVQAILQNQVVVICGETGSGKSTQLPKICLQAGRGLRGFIGHTQPRRIAARKLFCR